MESAFTAGEALVPVLFQLVEPASDTVWVAAKKNCNLQEICVLKKYAPVTFNTHSQNCI